MHPSTFSKLNISALFAAPMSVELQLTQAQGTTIKMDPVITLRYQ